MPVRLFLFTVLVSGFINLYAAPARSTQSLDGKWNIVVDWYNVGNAEDISNNRKPANRYDLIEFSFDNSQTLDVPGDWNSQKPELKYYEGIIWYLREFDYQPENSKEVYLNFGGVSSVCDVYLNGNKLGRHEGSFTSFEFDATKFLKKGKNILVLKVDNIRRIDAIPAMKFDWWNYGGITRSVSLKSVPVTHIANYFIQLSKKSLNEIQGYVQMNAAQNSHVLLQIPEAHISKDLVTDNRGFVAFKIPATLSLWSPEHPKMYDVSLSTSSDTITEQIGFRCIEVQGDKILLNKKPVFLRGISFHEEIPQRQGRAFSETDSRMLLDWAKELGCNFIRLAHYPQNENTIKLAEKMGFMMWEEIPVWQGIAFKDSVILGKAKKMLHDMIDRDKNRCGIIIWSLSNETAPSQERNDVLINMAASARLADPTRLISSAFDHFSYKNNHVIIEDTLSKYLDVMAVNKYFGWYAKWPAEPGNVIWESSFNKPMIVSEFGAEALYGNHAGEDTAGLWTEEYQEQIYKDNIKMFDKIPFLCGVSPWILADFRSPFRMQATYQQGWNRKGLISDRGFKKKAWYIIQQFYENKKRLYN